MPGGTGRKARLVGAIDREGGLVGGAQLALSPDCGAVQEGSHRLAGSSSQPPPPHGPPPADLKTSGSFVFDERDTLVEKTTTTTTTMKSTMTFIFRDRMSV